MNNESAEVLKEEQIKPSGALIMANINDEVMSKVAGGNDTATEYIFRKDVEYRKNRGQISALKNVQGVRIALFPCMAKTSAKTATEFWENNF